MIVSLIAVSGTDLVLSGGHDGFLRSWKYIEAEHARRQAEGRTSENDTDSEAERQGEEDLEEEEEEDHRGEENGKDQEKATAERSEIDQQRVPTGDRFHPPHPKRGGLAYNGEVAIEGYVNSLALDLEGDMKVLVAATGREHRCGRWRVFRGVRERITVFCYGSGGEGM